ncbi:hypothetical protein BJY01DRAFT_256001 [Aspergillus pseudoustus]|uniref:AMP-dependent synthetase/ligase domain-containing protein n=1 Tax=Aspergillus pseudoustus TaxID=1810923 RepID=A0ABR4IHM6_9EURO
MAIFNPVSLIATTRSRAALEVLKRCLLIITTSAVFPEQLGRRLVEQGVRLVTEYGMSELAIGQTSAPRLRVDSEESQAIYELVVLPSHPSEDKCWANTGDGAFRRGDVFVKHPTAAGRYRCIGRLGDYIKIIPKDVIALNALEYESKVRMDNEDVLDEVVLVGDERPRPGAPLFPKQGTHPDADAVLERVWATIEKDVNGVLPARLDRGMLRVVHDTPVARTGKGNVIRPQVYSTFGAVIESMYDA